MKMKIQYVTRRTEEVEVSSEPPWVIEDDELVSDYDPEVTREVAILFDDGVKLEYSKETRHGKEVDVSVSIDTSCKGNPEKQLSAVSTNRDDLVSILEGDDMDEYVEMLKDFRERLDALIKKCEDKTQG